MIKRTLSSIFLLLILSCSIYFGKAFGFSALILALAFLASYEACQIEKKCGLAPRFWVVGSLIAIIFIEKILQESGLNSHLPAILNMSLFCVLSPTILFGFFAVAALKSPYDDYPIKTLVPEFLTVMALGYMLSCFVKIAFFDVKMAVWAILVIKLSDIGGYLFGSRFGTNKIAPSISPKKSYEGLMGSVFLSCAGGMAMAHYLLKESFNGIPVWIIGAVCAFIAVVALLSDLVESALKRKAGVKDSGSTLPGIGGALDLADSLILTTPVMAFILL